MRIEHIKMAFINRHIRRLADRATRMMQPFRHIAQFHEFLEIGHGRVAAPLMDIPDKGRAIDRGQHQRFAPDLDIAFRVAGILGKARGSGFAQIARQTARNAHPLALNISARLFPKGQRLGVIGEIDADLFENGFGVILDDLQRLV